MSKKSFFEKDDIPVTGADLHWLWGYDKIVIVDYPVTKAVDEQVSVSEPMKTLLGSRTEHYMSLIKKTAALKDFFKSIPTNGDPAGLDPFWYNGWFPPLDAISLCALIYDNKPKRYIEVGSGNSTKFARKLISEFKLGTQIISIDPEPRAAIDQLCDNVVRQELETLPALALEPYSSEDMFFLDSSHRSFRNSDVTVFFCDLLSRFPSGMLYGVHDIFLPSDYPQPFHNRYYNEQYLLHAYLAGGASGDKVVFPSAYVKHNDDLSRIVEEQYPFIVEECVLNKNLSLFDGSAFWMRRG